MGRQSLQNPSRTLAYVGGILQSVAAFLPAVRFRLLGSASFLRVHATGGVLLALGILMIVAANRRQIRWVAVVSVVSMILIGVMYVQIVTTPSRTFADVLVRHVVHPAWGFIPMIVGALLGLVSVIGMIGAPKRAIGGVPPVSSLDS